MKAHRGWSIMLQVGGFTILVLNFLLPGFALASDTNKLRTEIADLEQQARNLTIRYSNETVGVEKIAEHRLVDAQVLYTLRDYTQAAILLFDYVSKYKHSRGYPEAVFYLADSLYNKRDFISAKKYFQLIVRDIKGKYYQDALQRLVELSLRTGDNSDVNEYLAALSAIPPNMLQPSVPYVRGKYYYFKNRFDEALASFRSIPTDNKYFLHSQYFVGAILVQKNDYPGAVQVYQANLRINPKSDTDQQVRDLSFLALGRLFYEQGKIEQAIDMYQKVSRRSDEFDTALYEIAWVYIKANEFRKALRALDLLVLSRPESSKIPQVKVLQGNLLIRLEEWGRATDLFTKTREKFVPIQNRMNQVLAEHNDPNVFFDILLARNVSKFGVVIQVPEVAVQWVKESPRIKRALNLVRDVREIQDSIKEINDLIDRIEVAINSPAKIRIFPEFSSAKASALEVDNRLLAVRKQILAGEKSLVENVMSNDEKVQLQELSAKRLRLEQEVKELPTTADGYRERERTKIDRLSGLEQEVTKLAVIIDSLRAQLVAAEKFFSDTQSSKDKAIQESFRKETENVRIMITGLQAEVDELRKSLNDAKSATGVGGAEEIAERGIKTQYKEALDKEHQLLASMRNRVRAADANEIDSLFELFSRCQSIDNLLLDFDKRLDAGVEEKLVSIRSALKEEKDMIGQYTSDSEVCKNQTEAIAGTITYDGFRRVAKRFYEIVVRTDVGIIDVAWALKDSKSKEVSRLVRQQKMDLKLLDDEFREVLRED